MSSKSSATIPRTYKVRVQECKSSDSEAKKSIDPYIHLSCLLIKKDSITLTQYFILGTLKRYVTRKQEEEYAHGSKKKSDMCPIFFSDIFIMHLGLPQISPLLPFRVVDACVEVDKKAFGSPSLGYYDACNGQAEN